MRLNTPQIVKSVGILSRVKGSLYPEVRLYDPLVKKVESLDTPIKSGIYGVRGSGQFKKALQEKLEEGPIGMKLWVGFSPKRIDAYHKIRADLWEKK